MLVHAPVVLLQQTPTTAHGVAHVVPSPWNVLVVTEQAVEATVVHAPVLLLQHAPVMYGVTITVYAPPAEAVE